MFRDEVVSNNIHIFVSDASSIDESKVQSIFSGYNGAVYVHQGSLDVNNLNLDTYDKFIGLD